MNPAQVVTAAPLPDHLPGARLRPRPGDPEECLLADADAVGRARAADRVADALCGFRIDALEQVLDDATALVVDVDRGFLDSLDILDRLDTAFLGTEAVAPRIRLADGTKRDRIDQEAHVLRRARFEVGGRILPTGAMEVLREGVTMVINDVAPLVRGPVLDFAQDLSRIRDVQTQVNCYTSEREAAGFGLHWDDHDVVIVQVLGRKRWEIHHPGALSPLRPWTPAEACGESILSVVLEPGMGLFIPRGWPHQVRGFPGVVSSHLTVGTRRVVMADALAESLDHLRAAGDPPFDGVPGWRGIDAEEVEMVVARQRAGIECYPTLGPFAVDRELTRLGPDSIVSAQLPGGIVFPDAGHHPDRVTVAIDGFAYGIDRRLVPAFARLVEGERVTVADLAASVGGNLDGVTALLRRLSARDIIGFHGLEHGGRPESDPREVTE